MEVPNRSTDKLAHPGRIFMKDRFQDINRLERSTDQHSDSAAETVTAALRNTFESMLEEPVPDRLQDLIERIRAEELRNMQTKDDNGQ